MDMNPRTKKIIEALGCDLGSSSKAAEEIMMGYLSAAEHKLEEQVLNVGDSPNLMMLHAAGRVPQELAKISAETRKNRESGHPNAPVNGGALAMLVALLAVSATSALKDMAFVMSRSIRCTTCDKRETCGGSSKEGDGPTEL